MLELLLITASLFTQEAYITEEVKYLDDNTYYCAVAESRGADEFTLISNGCK